MTIPFTGNGSLFKTWGHLGGLLWNVNGLLGTVAPSPGSAWGASGPTINDLNDNINNIVADFQANANIAAQTDTIYSQLRNGLRSVNQGTLNLIRTFAQNVVINLASADQVPNPLTGLTLQQSLALAISQMKAGGFYINPSTITTTATAGGSNNGNGVLVVSPLRGDGTNQQYLYNETINLTCTSDSQLSSGTLNRETFNYASAASETTSLAWDWPLGSSSSGSLTAIDSASGSPNLITNGSFETYTIANIPDGWTYVIGAAGTDYLKNTTTVFDLAASLQIVQTAGVLLDEMYFPLTGLSPDTVYCINLWMRKTNAAETGIVRFDLYDGTSTINNDAAIANSFTQNVASLSNTAWTAVNGFFVTPKLLPATIRLRVKVTTALGGGTNAVDGVLLDRMAFVVPTPLYGSTRGGPLAALFSAGSGGAGTNPASKFILNDTFAVTVANNYGGKFQKLLWQLFDPASLGLQFPYTGSTLINDNLIL